MAETIPARYIKLRANAGTRVHVPTKYLTPGQQKQRARNLQVKKDDANPLYNPLVPMGGHALKTAADRMAAADVGPEISQETNNIDFLKRYAAATSQRMGDLYGQMAARIPGYQAANATSSQNLTDAIAANGRVAQGNVDAAQNASVAGQAAQNDVTGPGLDAGTSQRLAATFAQQKQDALTSQSAQKTEAEQFNAGFTGLINAAAAALPGQQALATGQALAPINKSIADTTSDLTASKAKQGNLGVKYLTDLRQSEFENEAARQTLKLKTADQAGINPITGEPLPADPSKTPEGQAANAYAKTFGTTAAKYGYDPHQWAMLGPAGRQKAITAAKAAGKVPKADHTITSGAYRGHKQSEIDAASPDQLKAWEKANTAGAKAGKGHWIPSVTAKKDLQTAAGALKQVRNGKLLDKKGKVLADLNGKSRQDVVHILTGSIPTVLISAVLDSIPKYNKGAKPHLSKETQQRLIHAGYKPSQVAEALGILTAGKYKKTETPAAYDALIQQIRHLGQ